MMEGNHCFDYGEVIDLWLYSIAVLGPMSSMAL